MQENVDEIDEVDLRLINALQLAPRGSWSQLAGALELDPATLGRRWQRLTENGNAWITVSPAAAVFPRMCTAFLEVTCGPGRAGAVAAELAEHRQAVTVEQTAGDADLLVTAGAPDLAAMSRFALGVVGATDGVVSVRTRIITQWFTQGSKWRLDALGPGERSTLVEAFARLDALGPGERSTLVEAFAGVPESGAASMTAADRELLVVLARDGRMSFTDLGEKLGIGAATARRRLDRLLQLELVTMRCEFARPLAGYAVLATFWGRVPPSELPATGRLLSREPEVRNCFAINGPNNLLVQVWLRSIADLTAFELRLAAGYPVVDLRDRSVVLRLNKLLGHVLDPDGRRVRSVVPDVWS